MCYTPRRLLHTLDAGRNSITIKAINEWQSSSNAVCFFFLVSPLPLPAVTKSWWHQLSLAVVSCFWRAVSKASVVILPSKYQIRTWQLMGSSTGRAGSTQTCFFRGTRLLLGDRMQVHTYGESSGHVTYLPLLGADSPLPLPQWNSA